MSFMHLTKLLYWDIFASKHRRFNYINGLISNLPGELGMELRSTIIPKYFRKAGKNVKIYPGVRFRRAENISVGNDVALGLDNTLQATGGLEIDDDTILGPGVKIWTINHRFELKDVPIVDQGYDHKRVKIGKGCWLAANVFIMPGVTLPDGCIVSAGSIVGIKKYPPYSIISGNPARVIGKR